MGSKNSKAWMMAELAFILLWLRNLSHTDAYFSVYVLCAAAGGYCLLKNSENRSRLPADVRIGAGILACLFAGATVAANYPLFEIVRNVNEVSAQSNRLMNLLEAAGSLLGGGFLCYQVLTWLAGRKDSRDVRGREVRPWVVFLGFFGLITVIDLVYLFFVVYPGNVSHDSMAQIFQNVSGHFNNIFPYWHTRLIGALLGLGYGLTGDVNGAVAFFSVFQILCISGCFAYAMMTLSQLRVSRGWFWIAAGLFVLMPYNIAYSASMWKDVPFGFSILLMVTAQLRLMKGLNPHRWVDSLCLILGGLGVCTSRTNGVYVMAVSFVILLLPLIRNQRRLLLPWVGVLLAGWILNGPALQWLGVSGLDDVEVMSLPLQQVGRVVVENGRISQEDLELLDHILDVETLPEIYQDWTSDPLKDQVKTNGRDFLNEHMQQYRQLWIRVGLDNPVEYWKAWVELTKGYWNAGYDYYVYAEYVADNDFGIAMTRSTNLIRRGVKALFSFTRESVFFEPLLSVGLQVWVVIGLLWLNVIRRRREWILFVPLLVILAGLWIGAPVFCEFRYTYPLFACSPLLLGMTFSADRQEKK